MATYQLWIDDEHTDLLRAALDDLGQYGGRIEVFGSSVSGSVGSLTLVPPRSMSVGVPMADVLSPPDVLRLNQQRAKDDDSGVRRRLLRQIELYSSLNIDAKVDAEEVWALLKFIKGDS